MTDEATTRNVRLVSLNSANDDMQAGFNRNLAVVIGIDAYTGGIPRLTTAVNDAARLASLLAGEHGYETVLLTHPATGQPVTRERLRALFEDELKARLGEDDRLLVYFAGHGVALDGDDGPRGYLVPQDARPGDSASMLAMTDLHAWLTDLPCRHMLAILDCCFAGAFRWAATRHLGALPDVIHKERYDRYLLSPAWQVLTSAAYDQKALDVLDGKTIGVRESDGTPHSPFAQALIDALEKGDADLVPKGQGDGVITATELYLYLREQVEVQAEAKASHEQTPGLWPLNKHRKGEFIFLAPGHPLNLPPAPDLTAEANPYRGLKSYDQKHAPLFFGRDDEIKVLVQRVDAAPFLAVLGASGTGKSSLVKAGLLPRLEVRSDARSDNRSDDFSRPAPPTATQAGSENSEPAATANTSYRVLPPMRPTDKPLQALAALLMAELGEDLSGLQDLTGLSDAIARWAESHPGQRLVLTIDQFEELATLCRDDGERDRFLRLLANAVQAQPDAFRLILTLRTDFEPQFTQKDSPLAEMWQAGRYVVPPMDIEDLRQVIEGPASVRVLYFDPPELVDDLIKEVIQTPGALPLLSFTLSELYVKYVRSGRDDRALSGEDYRALGGVVGSLRNRATEEYGGLPDDAHRLTMQQVMLRMVAVEGGELARRRVALSELDYPTAEENARVQTVLDRLVDARLLVRGTSDPSPGSGQVPNGTKGEAYVEPAHDALVLAWDKLLRWKQEAEEYLPLQRRLAQAAGEWSKAAPEAKSGLLWNDDPRLPQVEETLWPAGGKQRGLRGRFRWARQVLWPKTTAPVDTKWLNGPELSFAQASVSRRGSTIRRIIGIAAVVMIALAGLASFAFYQANQAILKQAEAEREARRSEAGELTAQAQRELATKTDTSGSLALILAREAVLTTWTTDHAATVNADATLRAAIDAAPPYNMTLPRHRHGSGVSSAKYSPNGRFIVTASADQTARIWDVTTGQEVRQLRGHTEGVNWAAYSPDGSQIVTASADGTARIWDAATGQEVGQLRGHTHSVNSAAYSPDGSQIVTASGDGTARIWNARTGKQVRILRSHTDSVSSAAYSPDGRNVVTASSDGTAIIWDAGSGRNVRSLGDINPVDPVTSAAYSPDGQFVVTAHYDGTAIIWGAESGEPVRSLGGHTEGHFDWVLSATYSPDGQYIVTAHEEREARIWVAATGKEIHQLNGHENSVWSAIYSPDGQFIVTASEDRTARIWDARTGQELRVLSSAYADFNSAVYSHNGTQIVTAEGDAMARVWDAITGQEVRQLLGHAGPVNSAAYSPDDSKIVTAGNDGIARIWDATTGQKLSQLSKHTAAVNEAVYSPDGQFIVTASDDKTARVWNASTGEEVRTLGTHTGPVNSVAYSPNGQSIITASDDRTARVWNASTGEEVRTLGPHAGPVNSVAYSPDGQSIVTASDDRTARVWNASMGGEVRTLGTHAGPVNAVVYSPDGQFIVTAGDDKTARVWNASTGEEMRTLGTNAEYINSVAYSPDGQFIVTANADGTARIWNTRTSTEMRTPGDLIPEITSAAYSPDGRFIITARVDGTARIWDTITGETVRTLNAHTGSVNSVAYSPNGKQIVTVGCSRKDDENSLCPEPSARLWDAATGLEVGQFTDRIDGYSSATFSPDGKFVVTKDDDFYTVSFWHVPTTQKLYSLKFIDEFLAYSSDSMHIVTADMGGTYIRDARTGDIVYEISGHSAAYSPDGRQIVTTGQDGTVRIWDSRRGQEVRRLNGHIDSVWSAIYSPDGKQIVTSGCDNRDTRSRCTAANTRIWDVATGREIRQLPGGTFGVGAYSPDGQFVITKGDDGTVRVWIADIDDLLAEAARLIQRDPPLLTPEERRQYGLDMQQ